MIINALTELYDILYEAKDQYIAASGYTIKQIPFFALISKEGELIDIIENSKEIIRGKNKTKQANYVKLPQRLERSGIIPNYLCDNGKFMFGLERDKRTSKIKVTQESKNYFDVFKQKNCSMLKDAKGENTQAIIKFLEKWKPEENIDNPLINRVAKGLGSDFLFVVNSINNKTSDDEEILSIWEKHLENQRNGKKTLGQCAVSGKFLPIARLHNKIKGVRDAPSTGALLVSFNKPAFESYNKEQSFNASISEEIMFKYTAALNYLLRDGSINKISIGGSTTVFWANSPKKEYAEIIQNILGINLDDSDESEGTDKYAEEIIAKFLADFKDGKKTDLQTIDLEENVSFHILMLSPNVSRLSVRNYYNTTFGIFMKNIQQHYQDMQLEKMYKNDFDQVPIWAIVRETISPEKSSNKQPKNIQKLQPNLIETKSSKSSNKQNNPLLCGAVAEAIFKNIPYPESLLSSIILRVKIDNDLEISHSRGAIIKACITRKNRINKIEEDIKMSLDTENKSQAYHLGRLFAVLEKVQQTAIPKINSTIKDRYFSSACSAPAAVFPTILKLAQSHLAKLNNPKYYEDKKDYEDKIDEIMNKLECAFPSQLNINDQGRFILGYYHQKKDLWTKKDKIEEKK